MSVNIACTRMADFLMNFSIAEDNHISGQDELIKSN